MKHHSNLIVILLFSLFTSSLVAEDSTAKQPDKAGIEFFEKHIRPVLVRECYACHSEEAQGNGKLKGGLFVDTREGIRTTGSSPAIVPGKVADSPLIEALNYESFEMPPSKKLPKRTIDLFVKWVEMGAPDPREKKAHTGPVAKIPTLETGRDFWAFQKPKSHPQPKISHAAQVQRPHDAFLLKKLENVGLSFSEKADKRTLVRRVYYDLTGLPPTPADVENFLNDPSPSAYANLVEELLNSPHFGERWARLWLDVSRYAEDQAHIVGSNKSLFYPNAYLYRDWVIQALNQDVPFDRFVTLQLANDLLDEETPADTAALGFIGLGPKYYSRNSPAVMADEWEDRIDTVSRGLLGLTVACARCHDHKFDPIPTTDYYALAGVFASTEMFNQPLKTKTETKEPQPKDAKQKQDNKKKKTQDPGNTLHIVRDKNVHDLNVMIRGDVTTKGPLVNRRFLTILTEGEPKLFQKGSGRLELAEAIIDRQNPLTARVFVNRIWGEYFGSYLVGTPSNFGQLGERPTHPELLDDLAVRFMDSGWSMKWLHKEIVMSAAYQQQSFSHHQGEKIDPGNRLLWRMNRKRFKVEAWRDTILAVTGKLSNQVGGPSINPEDTQETRRTIYSFISRFQLTPLLSLFDFPDPNVHAAKRAKTTTPLQKMFVLNNPFMVDAAETLATRILNEGGNTETERIEFAYELLYSREVKPEERQLALAFLGKGSQEQWTQYAHVLLASNEMLFLD